MAYTTIKKPSDYFNTKLYTGNSSTQNITGLDFQPDWVAIKDRDATNSFMTFDAVRGATELLNWNTTNAESTQTPTLTSFNSDGFSIGNNTALNTNGNNLVAWNWKANGAGVANTDGSISSTVSANTTSGFSIVKWTGNNGAGATVGHGLGSIPKIVLVKNSQQSGYDWVMYHASLGNTKRIWLNLTNAVANAGAGGWNNTTPSSSVFTLGTSGETNGSGEMIGYCFAEKQGFSKFGSYTGNGNADGTFVYTGFKPSFIIRKNTDGGVTESWIIEDNKRNTFNPVNEMLIANGNNAEVANNFDTDFLSNGFKMRTNNDGTNRGSTNYIYMAFAEEPLVGDNPATAR